MGPVRTEVMWHAVLDAVAAAGSDVDRLTILDLGGGTGGDAVRLAAVGHDVTVVDPSPDALASLERRASDAARSVPDSGVTSGRVTGVLGDTTDLLDHVPAGSVDLVVCHGVLEHVDDPAQALQAVGTVLRPGGHVSVVVAGRLAAVVARALAGDFAAATRVYSTDLATWDLRTMGPRRFVAAEVDDLLAAHGFTAVASRALRVFTDLVPSALVGIEPGQREALYALERLVADDRDFTALSGGLQLIARLDS